MTKQKYSDEEKDQIYQYGKAYLESLGIYDIDAIDNKGRRLFINYSRQSANIEFQKITRVNER